MSNYSRGSLQLGTPVVQNLIILNALVFFAQSVFKDKGIDLMGSLHHFKSPDFKPFQYVTSIFMHAGIGHIFFNMFSLFMFGTILERVWGAKRFLLFYLVCGLFAGLFQQLLSPYAPSLGASGAIMGLMAAFGYLFPNTEMMFMFLPFPMKAKYLIPIIVAIDLFGGVYKLPGDNIAHFAHLGGAIMGFLLVLYWNKTNKKTFY